MTREWKPGDVAMLTCETGQEYVGMITSVGDRLTVVSPTYGGQDPHTAYAWGSQKARPLVVIDPEDRAKIGQLLKAQVGTSAGCPDALVITNVHIDRMQAALRSLVIDPKPEEPTGLGAVVEDSEGALWVRADADDAYPWRNTGGDWTDYPDIAAVRVLSDGVTA